MHVLVLLFPAGFDLLVVTVLQPSVPTVQVLLLPPCVPVVVQSKAPHLGLSLFANAAVGPNASNDNDMAREHTLRMTFTPYLEGFTSQVNYRGAFGMYQCQHTPRT